MSNTLGGWDATIIAQEGFSAFKQALVPLGAFTTDFSTDIAQNGVGVTTRVISAMTAGDWSSTYASGDTTTTAVAVTLDQHKFRSFHLTDKERTKGPAVQDTNVKQAREAAYAVGKAVVDYVLGLCLAATYGDTDGTHKVTKASASVGVDDIAQMVGQASALNMPEMNRSLIISNAIRLALMKDNQLQGANTFGTREVIAEGSIARLLGCDVRPYTTFPSALTAQNTTAILAHPSAIAFAGRLVNPPPEQSTTLHMPMQDPESGIVLGYRQFYDDATATMWGSFEILFGATAAQTTGGIIRLVSA